MSGFDPFVALQVAIPPGAVAQAVEQTGSREQRRRRLPSELVVALVIGLGLWSRINVRAVLSNLVEGLRIQEPRRFTSWRLPAKSALTQARQRIGPRPLQALFHQLAGPVATPSTPGAFLFGLRLMAVDGSTMSMPDTPQNAAIFGKPSTSRGGQLRPGAFPLARVVVLIESGTHVLCDAVLRPYSRGEDPAARQLLRSVSAGMLLMWDRGLHSYAMVRGTLDQGAHFLGRVASNVVLKPEQEFADGSWLSYIYPDWYARERRTGGIPVRVIAYTIDPPHGQRPNERYRVITSLLDPVECPAHTLAVGYHERWEVESSLDELKTHLMDRRPFPQLRSGRPREIVQEIYGALIAHFAIRRLMAAAAATSELDPDRLSFTETLHVLHRAVPRLAQPNPQSATPFCSTSS